MPGCSDVGTKHMGLNGLLVACRAAYSRLCAVLASRKGEVDMQCVDSNESITRYIFSRSQFRPSGSVRYSAFMPRHGETSVFRIDCLTESEIWRIGVDFAGAQRQKRPYARGDVVASLVRSHGLDVAPEVERSGHACHANIIGWSAPDSASSNRLLATKIANSSLLNYTPENR